MIKRLRGEKINKKNFFNSILMLVALFLSVHFVFAQEENLCQFKRALFLGLKGNDVKCLQEYLEKERFFNFPKGPTGYYGKITEEAVKNWQIKYNIKPATGIFGTKSIKKYLEIKLTKTQTKQIIATTSSLPTKAPTLFLPEIKDSEIKISENGFKNVVDYLDYYFTKLPINFDQEKVSKFLEKGDINFMPHLLIEEILNSTSTYVSFLEEKLSFIEDVYKQKIDLAKKIEVSPELVNFHKKILAVDYLTIGLFKKYEDYKKNIISKEEINQFLQDYKVLTQKESIKVRKELSIFLPKNNFYSNKIINKFLNFLDSIFKPVFAAIFPPFGGMILLNTPCACPVPGSLLTIGPPVGGNYFASFLFLSSPLFFLYKQIHPGAWVLGLASPVWVRVPCGYVGFLGVCIIFNEGLNIIMMGTSL